MANAGSAVSIARGTIIIYRIFDVAEEIDLERIERELTGAQSSSRLKLARSTGQALILRDAPFTFALGALPLRLGSTTHTAELFVRTWSYGVVSLQFLLPIPSGASWASLVELAACVEDESDVDDVARARVRDLTQGLLRSVARLPHEPQGMEDYVVYLIEELHGVDVQRLAHVVDIPALILGEPHQKLSDEIRKSILESSLAYSARDLAVIDWNSALLIEPEGSRDVADMLEFAATHLMEFRHYDTLLDDKLESLYRALNKRRPVRTFFSGESERLLNEASSLFIEFSEHVERIENSLKFVGDFYLATVFRRAALRFQLKEWEDNVMRKVNALARVSEVLSAETNVRRSHVLEIIIIILILYEVVHAALGN